MSISNTLSLLLVGSLFLNIVSANDSVEIRCKLHIEHTPGVIGINGQSVFIQATRTDVGFKCDPQDSESVEELDEQIKKLHQVREKKELNKGFSAP